VEAQALFPISPYVNAAGQYIEVYYTFVDRTNICNDFVAIIFKWGIGLFNSGGSAPTNGTSSGMVASIPIRIKSQPRACQNWVGYNGPVCPSHQIALAIFRHWQSAGTNWSKQPKSRIGL